MLRERGTEAHIAEQEMQTAEEWKSITSRSLCGVSVECLKAGSVSVTGMVSVTMFFYTANVCFQTSTVPWRDSQLHV